MKRANIFNSLGITAIIASAMTLSAPQLTATTVTDFISKDNADLTILATNRTLTLQSGITYCLAARDNDGIPQISRNGGIVTKVNDYGYLSAVEVTWPENASADIAVYSFDSPVSTPGYAHTGTLIGTVAYSAGATTTFTAPEGVRYIGITSADVDESADWVSIAMTWTQADLPPADVFDTTASGLVINEIMQSNVECYYTDNVYPDSWVELYNTSDTPVAINGWRIGTSDDFDSAYTLTGYTVAPGGYLIINCDKEATGDITTGWRLESTSAGAIYLFNPGGTLIDSLEYPMMPGCDIAYARIGDDATTWGYPLTATPGASNTLAVAASAKVLPAPKFSNAGGLYDSPMTVVVTIPSGAPADAVLAVTTDGRTPGLSDAVDGSSYTLDIDSTTVVRARLLSPSTLAAMPVTESYIFHPRSTDMMVISIATDPDNFYDPEKGILYGTEDNNPNWANDWRRPINIEVFDAGEHRQTINQIGETRVMGNHNRLLPQKCLNVYANKRFGTKRFDSTGFWPDKPEVTKVKSFNLRNGGNDFNGIHMRDQFAQTISGRNTSVDWCAYRPVICYINGVYQGIYDLRERSNEDMIEANYGIDNPDVIEDWWDVESGTVVRWDDLIAPMGKARSVSDFAEITDLDTYLDMMAVEIFGADSDFLTNNIVCWRPGPYTKWRWLLKDIDRFCASYMHPDYNYFDFIDGRYNNTNSTGKYVYNLFYFFVNDADASDLLVDRLMLAMGDYLQADYALPLLQEMLDEIMPEYQAHIDTWYPDGEYTLATFNHSYDKFINWYESRPANLISQMQERFGLGETYPLTIDRKGMDVTANGVHISRPVFNGQYFQGKPLNLAVNEEDGAWEIKQLDDNGNQISSTTTNGPTATINPSDNLRLLATPIITTGVDNVADDTHGHDVTVAPGQINVTGDMVMTDVYTPDGRHVRHTPLSSINLPTGIYIVTVNGTNATKVVVP